MGITAAALAAIGLAGCGGGDDGGNVAPGDGGTCTSMKAANASVTSSLSSPCVNCSLDNAAAAADGNFTSAATFTGGGPTATGMQTATIRATAQPGIVFAAGSAPAAIFANDPNTYYTLTINTYLMGVMQETSAVCGLCGYQNPGTRQSGFTSTKPYDAVEVALGSTESSSMATVTQRLYEICSNH